MIQCECGRGVNSELCVGEMTEIEGFLCPLCMQDCRSVQDLERHYREKHDESSSSASKFKKDVISFFEQVGNSLKLEPSPRSPRRAERAELGGRSISEEESSVVGPVTNVSGIDPLQWDPQDMGTRPPTHTHSVSPAMHHPSYKIRRGVVTTIS